MFDAFPRDDAVKQARHQWWEHHQGAEYLAANPIIIPTLPGLLRSCTREDSPFDQSEAVFSTLTIDRSSPDLFGVLPLELQLAILDHLGMKDIISLRLASHTIRQLPPTFFRRLLKDEMPWLWEVWCEMPVSHWAMTSAKFLKEQAKEKVDHEQELRILRKVIEEEMPELLPDWVQAEPEYAPKLEQSLVDAVPSLLPSEKTDWYAVYKCITANWNRLKGLQNRRRIWKDAEEWLNKVEKARNDGAIPDGRLLDADEHGVKYMV